MQRCFFTSYESWLISDQRNNFIYLHSKHENLKRLFVVKNSIRDWNEVIRFERWSPNLCSLSVVTVTLPKYIVGMFNGQKSVNTFPELDHLNSRDTQLQSSNDIFQLTKLNKLRKLCIRCFIVYSMHTANVNIPHRNYWLEFLQALEILKNSMILNEDRWDASCVDWDWISPNTPLIAMMVPWPWPCNCSILCTCEKWFTRQNW